MQPEMLDTPKGRNDYVRQARCDNPSLNKNDFKRLVQQEFPGELNLVSNLCNAFWQVANRGKLDANEGRDDFVRQLIRTKKVGREEFHDLVTRRFIYFDTDDLAPSLMISYDHVMPPVKLDTKDGRIKIVRQALKEVDIGREGFKRVVTRNYPGHDQGDLVSKLMDAYDEFKTRHQLDQLD